MSVALYAGSFDPIHLGHLDVIECAAVTYDEVVVAVVANPAKAAGLFTPDERRRLVAEATSDIPAVRAVQFHGLTVDLAGREGATVLVRAAHKEQGSELAMAATNHRLAGIPTVLVAASPSTRAISSSFVRALVEAGDLTGARGFVPACVAQALEGAASRMSAPTSGGSRPRT